MRVYAGHKPNTPSHTENTMAHSSAVNLAILEALKSIEAKLDSAQLPVHEFITQAKPEVLEIITKASTSKASTSGKGKTKVAKTNITLPEGWKAIEGMNELRTKGYNECKALHPKAKYQVWNAAGLRAVAKALA